MRPWCFLSLRKQKGHLEHLDTKKGLSERRNSETYFSYFELAVGGCHTVHLTVHLIAIMLRLAARAGPLSSVLRCGAPALLRPALATRAVRPCVPIPVLRAASRCCSGTAAGGGDSGKKEADDKVFEGQVFEGAKNKVVTTIKKVSIANLGFAIASVPVLQYITAASGNPGKGVAMSALVRKECSHMNAGTALLAPSVFSALGVCTDCLTSARSPLLSVHCVLSHPVRSTPPPVVFLSRLLPSHSCSSLAAAPPAR